MTSTANSTIAYQTQFTDVDNTPQAPEKRMKVIWDQLKEEQSGFYHEKDKPIRLNPSFDHISCLYFDFINS